MKTRMVAAALGVLITASVASGEMFDTSRDWLQKYNRDEVGQALAIYYLAGLHDLVNDAVLRCPPGDTSYRTLAAHVADYLRDHPDASLGYALGYTMKAKLRCEPVQPTPASKERF